MTAGGLWSRVWPQGLVRRVTCPHCRPHTVGKGEVRESPGLCPNRARPASERLTLRVHLAEATALAQQPGGAT